jgi:hypothetical protein
MKISSNGAPVCTGVGVATVRKTIEDAFAIVRTDVRKDTIQPEIETVEEVKIDIKPEPAPEKALPSLAERAAPILRVAEHRFQHAVGRRHHHPNVHIVSVPTETAQELFDAALKLLGGKR